jgi:hypothetical protein
MCNAWNHSLDCSCGWGGMGHSGRRTFGNGPIFNIPPKFKSYSELVKSCTNPNAKCPVCGDPVFFYRSPSNGRVFFDELGPPWPKHPCTSTFYTPVLINNSSDSLLSSPNLNFFDDKEWKPFLLEGILRVDQTNNIYEIVGLLRDKKLTFYTAIEGITSDFPFFIKESDSEVRLLTFKVDSSRNNIFEFVVKRYRSELIPNRLDNYESKKKRVLNFNTLSPSQISNPKPSGKNKPKNNARIKQRKQTVILGAKFKQSAPKPAGKLQDQLSKIKKDLLKV